MDSKNENLYVGFPYSFLQVIFKPFEVSFLMYCFGRIKFIVLDCRELASLLGGEISPIPWRC
jgi:hypothetical protein